MSILYIDFETVSQLKLKVTGTWAYICDPSTKVIMLSWAFDSQKPQTVLGGDFLPAEVVSHILAGGVVVATNAEFERAIFQEHYGFDNVEMRCTASMARYLTLPPSLDGNAKALGFEGKLQAGKAKLRKHFKAKSIEEIPHEDLALIIQYCEQDVEATRAIHEAMGELPARELAVWKLDQKINARGINVDVKLAQAAISIVDEAKAAFTSILSDLTEGKVTAATQRQRILEWIQSRGVEAEDLKANTVEQLLAGELEDDVREVLLCRQRGGGSATGKYSKVLHMEVNGLVRGNLKYYGATTGRWSGAGFQAQNLPRGNVDDTDALADMFLRRDVSAIVDVAGNVFDGAKSAVRPLIRASEGSSLVIADYSSIEARVLAYLAGQHDLLDQFRSGEDIYCSFASKIFGKQITKADKRERMVGKVGILGLGYGMGALKFQATLLDWCGMEVSLKFAQNVVDTYRGSYGRIKSFWYELENGAIDCMRGEKRDETPWTLEGGRLTYTLCSGRDISYQRPWLSAGKYDNQALNYWKPLGPKMFRTNTYSGKLAENIVQATARDIMASAMLELDEAGYDILLTVHDEIIIESSDNNDLGLTLKTVEGIMSQQRDWHLGLPLAVEGFVTKRFKK